MPTIALLMWTALAATPPAEPRCPDLAAARKAVVDSYEAIATAYRDVLPGPRGEELREREVDRILDGIMAPREFARRVLRKAWGDADAKTRDAWAATMHRMLRVRYQERLREPHRREMTVMDLKREGCHQVQVVTKLTSKRTAEAAGVVFQMIWVGDAKGSASSRKGAWKLYDVVVDRTSMLLTWRSRFSAAHKKGGLAAVKREMDELATRYQRR